MNIKQVEGNDRDFFLLSKKLENFQFALMPCLKDKGYSLTEDLSDILGFIMYDEDKPIASIGLKKIADEKCEIVRVFVDEDYRGRGLAKQLFKNIEDLAVSLGYKTAEMVAWTKSESAISLYKKIGYTASEERDSEWFVGLRYVEFEKELKFKGKYTMDNKEIELKFIIDKDKRGLIETDLKQQANFEFEKRQIDTYYIPNFKSFEVNGETQECVRIRESNGKAVLCYKYIHRDASPVYCDEYELEISSKADMEKILFALGFSVQMCIDKVRKSYSLANFEFDFDTVNGVLELFEVELKDNNATTEQILNYVEKYGLTKENVTYRGIQLLVKDLGI